MDWILAKYFDIRGLKLMVYVGIKRVRHSLFSCRKYNCRNMETCLKLSMIVVFIDELLVFSSFNIGKDTYGNQNKNYCLNIHD